MPRVLIYSPRLLPFSQTFIRQHYDSMRRYEPVFAGCRTVDGIDTSDTRRILLCEPGARVNAKMAAFKLLGYAPEFHRQIEAARPDIIHAHFATTAVDMLPIAKRLRVPLVVTLHGYVEIVRDSMRARPTPIGWNYLLRRRKLWAYGSRFLPVSEALHWIALSRGFPVGKTTPHYLGIDLSRFDRSEGVRDSNTVLFVGRINRQKGLTDLIRLFAKYFDDVERPRLRVIGDGPMREHCSNLADSLGVAVEWLGLKPNDQVAAEMARATLLAMPSNPTTKSPIGETFGLVAIEGMASGLPVVCSGVGGLIEAAGREGAAVVVPPGDWQAFADAIRQILTDTKYRDQLAAAGRRRVREMFDVSVQREALESLYDSAIRDHIAK